MSAQYLFVCLTVLALPFSAANRTNAEPLGLGRVVDLAEIEQWMKQATGSQAGNSF